MRKWKCTSMPNTSGGIRRTDEWKDGSRKENVLSDRKDYRKKRKYAEEIST